MQIQFINGTLHAIAENVEDTKTILALENKGKEKQEDPIQMAADNLKGTATIKRRYYKKTRTCTIAGCNFVAMNKRGLGLHKQKMHGIPGEKIREKMLTTGEIITELEGAKKELQNA